MNFNFIILASSIAIQAANVLLAIRLILRTRNYVAGIMIISAVLLMVFRRAISLYRNISGDGFRTDPVAESVALVISILFLLGILYATRLIESEMQVRRDKEKLIVELQNAIAEIKTLEGIIPICASCKKIRDDKGSWNNLEHYLSKHSTAEFSHGICPECMSNLYPDIPRDRTK